MSEFFLFFIRLFPFFYRTFSTQKKAKFFFPFYRSFSPSLQRFYLHFSTYHSQPVWKEKLFRLLLSCTIMKQCWYLFGNLNIYVVKLKKYENNSAPSWVLTRALVVRRLERGPLTWETIPTALRLLVTWPTAWDAPFSYQFYFEKPYCCWCNRFPTVKKQIYFSKCRFYIAIYRWSLVIKNFIKLLF